MVVGRGGAFIVGLQGRREAAAPSPYSMQDTSAGPLASKRTKPRLRRWVATLRANKAKGSLADACALLARTAMGKGGLPRRCQWLALRSAGRWLRLAVEHLARSAGGRERMAAARADSRASEALGMALVQTLVQTGVEATQVLGVQRVGNHPRLFANPPSPVRLPPAPSFPFPADSRQSQAGKPHADCLPRRSS